MNRNKILRTAAKEFAGKISRLSSPLEIAVVGSVSGGDPYSNDLDLTVIVRNLDELATVAKYAVLEDIGIECMLCGKTFISTGDEQKRYQKRGLSLPGRCPDCIEHEGMGEV